MLYSASTNEPLLTETSINHIIDILRQKGTDYWWEGPAEDFVAPEYRGEGQEWVKGKDTMDVWFDSGVSWSHIKALGLGESDEQARPIADLYLEGSDQHRGWFQSSVLTAVASMGVAPFSKVVTHGFVLDENGRKMAKSEGNVISPLSVIRGGKVCPLFVPLFSPSSAEVFDTVECKGKERTAVRSRYPSIVGSDERLRPRHHRRSQYPTVGC